MVSLPPLVCVKPSLYFIGFLGNTVTDVITGEALVFDAEVSVLCPLQNKFRKREMKMERSVMGLTNGPDP